MFEKADVLLIPGVDEVLDEFNGSEGGFKLVFKCNVGGQLNAVKVTKVANGKKGVNQEVVGRLRRELDLLGALSSPYLPKLGKLPVQRVDKEGDVYIAYSEEFIDGADVCELTETGVFSDIEQTKKLIHDVSSGIQIYWNHNKTVHRDIKPANIRFSSQSGDFILIDAGIAYVRDVTTITPTGQLSPRTPAYTSPEVIRGQRNFTFRTDLFSLGVVAYEALTGTHPYYVSGMRENELYEAILNRVEPAVSTLRSDVPKELSDLVGKMLMKRQHQRPGRISDIISTL